MNSRMVWQWVLLFRQRWLTSTCKNLSIWLWKGLNFNPRTFLGMLTIRLLYGHMGKIVSAFNDCLNSIHPNTKFTIEVEKNGYLPFLVILIYKTAHGMLGHRVYRKPTHTDLHLNKNSLNHHLQKSTVLRTLLHRAIMVSDSCASCVPSLISYVVRWCIVGHVSLVVT